MKPTQFQTKLNVSKEMFTAAYDHEVFEDIVKRQVITDLSKELYDNVKDYIKKEPQNHETIDYSIDLIIMTKEEWNKLVRELNRLKNANILNF